MMASHMAIDCTKNAGFRCRALNDAAFLTALSNDICYEEVFAEQIRQFADSGDVLVAISSSGNSENIVRAIHVAREMGLVVITLTGLKPDNR